MPPSRSASVRQAVSPTVRKAHFRDDTSLVGLRYEKTTAAQPPIPIISRSASVRRPARTLSRSTSYASLHTPVVVVPPHGAFLEPPVEVHPALRTEAVEVRGRNRDSGHGANTSSSSSSIPEESCDDIVSVAGCDTEGDVTMPDACHKSANEASSQHVERPSNDTQAQLDAELELVATNMTSTGLASPPPSEPTSPTTPSRAATFAQNSSFLPSTPSPSPSPARQNSSARRNKLIKRSSSSSAGSRGSFWRHSSPPMPYFQTMPTVERGSPNAPATKPLRQPSMWPTAYSFNNNASSDVDAPDYPSFSPLGISIPNQTFVDDDLFTNLNFSQRGSIMGFGGAMGLNPHLGSGIAPFDSSSAQAQVYDDESYTYTTPTQTTTSAGSDVNSLSQDDASSALHPVVTARGNPAAPPAPDARVPTTDAELESQKVRSLYEAGDAIRWEDGARHSFCDHLDPTPEVLAEDEDHVPRKEDLPALVPVPELCIPRSAGSSSHHQDTAKSETGPGGGLEDWEDVDNTLVDRYGFITVPRIRSRVGTPTELKSAQFSPRRRNVLQKRDPMGFTSGQGARRMPSRKVSARSLNTQHSHASVVSFRSSRSVLRQAGNMFPHNRSRRWMDEAGDMLTVAPNLQDDVEEAHVEKISEAIKRKEVERAEKWRKMAKVIPKGDEGQGMEFEFDVKNPKLIERTWKGIPDRWRATAWWAFLESAAKESKDAQSSQKLIEEFHRLQNRWSPDDSQIDLDVPRTVGRHVMFRKRYSGGQRLLFRVLHALSIHFPDTGYVQGMASLAATLLCYFEEEKCFVMLVRMWQLRGLQKLYLPGDAGLDGLMAVLHAFDASWLNKEVGNRLSQLGLDTTAYGTRWYLTLFNLSLPFPAQLRVWDVFLLGEGALAKPKTPASGSKTSVDPALDVLHATSAALIQALREVLLDSDFENALKALTSPIPVKDEDLLMKVTKAEWKTHHSKKRF